MLDRGRLHGSGTMRSRGATLREQLRAIDARMELGKSITLEATFNVVLSDGTRIEPIK